MKKLLSLLIFIFITNISYGQVFTQTFVDRCTGDVKVVTANFVNGSATVAFYDKIKVFTYQQYLNGELQAWLIQTYEWWQALSPCSSTTTQVQQAQQTAQTAQQAAQTAQAAASTASSAASTASSAASSATNATTNVTTGGGTNATTNTTQNTTTNNSSTNQTSSNTSESSSGQSSSGSSEGGTGESSSSKTNNSSESGKTEGSSSESKSEGENKTEESKTEETKSEESGGDGEEGNSEESSSDDGDGEESKEEVKEEEKKEDKKEEKKKKEKVQMMPIQLKADAMAMQNPLGGYNAAINFGASRSSIFGDVSYTANLMVFDNLRQATLSLGRAKIYMDESYNVDWIESIGLSYGNNFGTQSTSGNIMRLKPMGKWGVAGVGVNYTFMFGGMLEKPMGSMGYNILYTNTYVRPDNRWTYAPAFIISQTPLSFTLDRYSTVSNDAMFILANSFTYRLTKRFTVNFGYTAIKSTNPLIPLISSFMIGSKLPF